MHIGIRAAHGAEPEWLCMVVNCSFN